MGNVDDAVSIGVAILIVLTGEWFVLRGGFGGEGCGGFVLMCVL